MARMVAAVTGVYQAHFGSDLRCDDGESESTDGYPAVDRGSPAWKAENHRPRLPLAALSPCATNPVAAGSKLSPSDFRG